MPPQGGLLSILPSSWVPYAELIRIDKPHGIFLVWVPHIVGLAYASAIGPSPAPLRTLYTQALRLMLWAGLCRSAGCVWNDIVDQDFDRKTARCRTRPIVRGAVTSSQACTCAAVLFSLAFLSLRDMSTNAMNVAGIVAVLSLVYPFCKRFTSFPQVVLGSSLGLTVVLSAWSLDVDVLEGGNRVPTICLMLAIMLLIVFYDVLYATQDTADDVKSGVKGMAVLFRNHMLALLWALTCGIAGMLSVLGVLLNMRPLYFVFSVGGLVLGLMVVVGLIYLPSLSRWRGLSGWVFGIAFASFIVGFFK
ncbi:4-hydroxybenzoate octaprenyltransferase [Aspergillus ibericus CBS 121593]|uniref:UbiA prenyltransferase n=1 Tax=Aspergillus ibericus CBS 121593 TaxID=1448316 RepID=A0A395GN74_9EURO|nr:hypothetical protein BO80DRAFT_458548 [Aspergillus ibericus CBS 121593]RAK96955.1 hypothetical protein BO80DRAFT_458548 [Aspergillus ibericus CBS 121593]